MNTPADIREIWKLKVDVRTPQSVALTVRLMRHVVAIYFDFMVNQQRRQFAHTAFVFSVENRWMLMTAGHCVTEIEQARALGGELKKCLLFDCMGENAVWAHPVPFPYDAAYPMNIGVKENIDYGVLFPPLGQGVCPLGVGRVNSRQRGERLLPMRPLWVPGNSDPALRRRPDSPIAS